MQNTTSPTTALAGQNREEHTALPWRTFLNYIVRNGRFVVRCFDVNSAYEATGFARGQEPEAAPEEAEANAAFIVRAVNSHAALVEALAAMIYARLGSRTSPQGRDNWAIWADQYRNDPKIDAALLRAVDALALAGKGAE